MLSVCCILWFTVGSVCLWVVVWRGLLIGFCCVFCLLSGASLYYSLWGVYGSCLTEFVILLCLFDLVGYV